ncbi:DUF3791 domain-containing protein [Emergencia timonensis]
MDSAACIEFYSNHIGMFSNEVYALFERGGVLKLLEDEYEDLHGMSMEYMMQFIDDSISRFYGYSETTADYNKRNWQRFWRCFLYHRYQR